MKPSPTDPTEIAGKVRRQTDKAWLMERIDKMTSAMQLMAAMLGTRLDRSQLAQRMNVHRNTVTRRLAKDEGFPRPGRDGKWLLSEVIEWERRQ